MSRGDRGAVLVVTLLLVLALLGLAHALLVSAEAAYTVSRAHARVATLDAAASGLLERGRAEGWSPWMDAIVVGQTRVEPRDVAPGLAGVIRWRRLGAEGWILRADVADGSGSAAWWRRLVWIYHPDRRVASFPGVVSVGSGAMSSILGSVVPDVVPTVGTVAAPGLGPSDLGHLLAASDTLEEAGTPGPVAVAGVCVVDAPWNWGEPRDSTAPCGAYFAAAGRSGDLTVEGGVGQGVWIVDGDVVVQDGAELSGVLIVSGRLDVRGGSTLRGRVVAYGGLDLGVASVIVGSPSEAERALAAVRDRLGVAVPVHPARRLGPG
ncbi:MAG: hypothetical protein R3304_03875 [Longimicrobiales bacterium]|nr:hypothetical protein [Longimicrobiales bacterium]